MHTAPDRQYVRVKSRQKEAAQAQSKPDFCAAGALTASAFAVMTAAAALLIAAKSRKKRFCKCK